MANFTSILTGKQVESLLANYATCATAGSTAAKVATISSINGAAPQFELFTGVTVKVKFTNSNTVASPELNVNGTGSKPIVRYGSTTPGTTAATSWSAGAIVSLTYDGTSWVMNDSRPDQYNGDITGVTAGSGLTGGATSGTATLNVGAGNGISVTADAVSAKAGSGITVDANGINANTSFTTSGKNYKVQVDSTSGGLFVNVPWQNDNTTYTAGEGIKITDNQIIARDHTHTVTHTPAGTVSQPTFTGDTVTSSKASGTKAVASSEHGHSVTAEGTVDLDISEVTSGGNYQPKGTVSGSFTGTAHKHTFTGTAATSTKPDTTNVSTVYSITGVGSVPSLTKTDTSPSKITEWSAGTLPNLTTKSEEVSLISSWSEGTLPTTTNITYVSGGSKSTVLTGVTHSGTTSVATGVTQGSGALVSYSEDANTNSTVKYDGEVEFIPVVHDVTVNKTQVSTGAKATSTGSVAPNEHTHTYTKATGVNLGSNDTATNGVQYVESITSTKASASGTAKVGSETHTHSHTPKGSVSIGVSADEVAGTYMVVTDASPSSVSTSTTNVAPNEHTHDITISGTTGTNSGTAVKAVTAVGSNGTATVLTGVKASSSENFLVSLTNGSGGLTSDTTSTDGITYVESVTHTAASLTGTKTFNTDAIKNVTLSASTTSTDGPKYIEDVTHTAASLTGTTTFNTDAIKKVAITASETRVDGDTQYVHSITGDAPVLTGDTTFVKSVSGGSGSLVAYDASSGGNAKTTNGNRIPFITSLSKGGYTPAGSVTLTNGTAPSLNPDTGTNTDIPYISSVTGGSAVSKTTKYMKFSAGTAPVDSATFSGTAVTSGGASTTTTSSAGANTSTTSNTGSAGAGSSANTGASTTISDASVSDGVLTITKSSHTHSYTKPAAHTHTYYAPVAHTHTLSHTHSVTAAGTISLARGTAPSMNFDTGSSSDTPYISAVSGGSAVSATTKYMKFTAGTTPKASASFSGTKSTAVVTGGTTYYLAHGHTAASGTTGTVGISGGNYVGNTWGLTLTTENASTGTVGISGGSISKTTKYMKRTTTAAGTGTVGISGGSISPVTKYLHHTHTPTTAGDVLSAITGVASNGTATVLTGVKATSTANVAPSEHTHTYGSSTAFTTTINSGTAVPAVTEVTYEAPTYTRQPLQATFTGTASNTGGPSATTTVVTGVTGGTASATKKYFHPTITTTSENTGKNSGTGITAVTGVGNNGLVDVISTVSSDQGWLKHTHTSAKASGTATAITGVKSNGTASAYTSLDTASAKAVNTVGSLPSLSYTDLTVLTPDTWSAGTLPTLEYATETSTKINSWSAGSVPTRSVIYVPNSEHTHNVTATGTIGDTTAGGTVSATFTGKQVLIEPTFTGKLVSTAIPNDTVSVASSDHTHTVKATGTVSKPSFTGTAATITSSTSQIEEDN